MTMYRNSTSTASGRPGTDLLRRIYTAFLVLLIVLPLAGYAAEKTVYTNLADKESRADVKKLLLSSGIGDKEAEAFLACVGRTADAFQSLELAGNEWRSLGAAGIDPYAFQDAWDKRFPDFLGYNCRITSFTLLKNHIEVENRIQEPSTLLAFDIAALQNAPEKLFDEQETAAFQTLFADISAEKTADSAVHIKQIQAYYQKQGISFSEGPRLVTVYLHDEDPGEPGRYYVFPGHAGVLIDSENGLYFVEKLAFQLPYQVTRFEDRAQLIAYLKAAYASFQTDGLSEIILMENDRPLLP